MAPDRDPPPHPPRQPITPPPPRTKTPAFQNVIHSAQSVAQQEQTHEPAEQKASQAQAAAQMPPEETAAHAQANQAGEMEGAETPAFDAAAFKAKLMARIEAMSPRTAQEADQFKESGKLDTVQSELQGEAAQQQDASQAPLEQAKDKPPDTGAVPEKPVAPLEPAQPGAVTTEINATQAAPKPKTSAEIEEPIQEEAQSLDEQMAEAEVTEEQLANSNEPRLHRSVSQQAGGQRVRCQLADRIPPGRASPATNSPNGVRKRSGHSTAGDARQPNRAL